MQCLEKHSFCYGKGDFAPRLCVRYLRIGVAQPHTKICVQAVLAPSTDMPEGTPTVQGINFDNGCDLDSIMRSMLRTGCQASALGQAIAEVQRMVTACLTLGGILT